MPCRQEMLDGEDEKEPDTNASSLSNIFDLSRAVFAVLSIVAVVLLDSMESTYE